jgi:uncharacterized protein YndB with AHSA1/START domain
MLKHKLFVNTRGDCDIVITRVFNAPRSLVFAAWTQPEHVKRWFRGCRQLELIVCDINLYVGGTWRYVLHDLNTGTDFALNGEYREIVPPERLVATERYELIPNSDRLNTLTLTEHNGKTTLCIHVQHVSKEQRDGHLRSGLEIGLYGTLNRLEECLQTMM